MIRFLDKEQDLHLLEQLFDLLYENMNTIAPSGLSYEEEKQQWLAEVGPAMKKPPRQIILMYLGDSLAGYMQYYIHNGIFMVEEIQLRKDCRATTLFHSLWKFVSSIIPEDTRTIEAYADRRNHHSRKLMQKLGMVPVEDDSCTPLLHFRGSLEHIRKGTAAK